MARRFPLLTMIATIFWSCGVNWGQAESAIVINELHTHPDVKTEQAEFIELYNAGTAEVDLSGWQFTDGVLYTFPAGTKLGADGYLIVAQNPDGIRAKWYAGRAASANRPIFGPYAGTLNNDGEQIVLRDAAGRVIDERDASGVSPDDLSRALEGFRGIISQTPPMFSAVRHAGQRLYEFARQGVEVERAARTVEISRLVLVDCAPPEATLEVDCSKGTYVRSLVDDLGARLGVGAVMTALVRTRVGPFSITEARPPGRLVSPSA